MTQFVLLSMEEFKQREAARRADGRSLADAYPPGTAYYCPWYHNPDSPNAEEKIQRGQADHSFLSVHYWTDWAHLRPPVMVTCPGGSQWCLDQKSSNGTGWVVVGPIEAPTVSPSIVVPRYHGFLQSGLFSDDLEGRT